MKDNLSPDIQAYFDEIAERLWTGHASVMVGAGFSKNAINTINPTKQPPNWWQLGDLLYEKLYAKKPKEIKYVSLLKLAEEFEAAFGRSALEHFIAKNISDNEYEPSDLHKMLMELPWNDVFTTNYDTLLERSCKDVISRRYDIVVNKNDLVYSNRPRIIKLHGSLPSERPFIITEEDYRSYPKKFAPFVNTVQQSLLENTLILLGFSGDDPNFLQWIGWINDNIGKDNASKIFLIGVLNLSESQKKLLNNKNIISVDLTSCAKVNGNHKKGLELLINYLALQRLKRNNLNWPFKEDLITYKSQREVENFEPLILEWYNCRKKYPNWLILPQEQRDMLWLYTENHSSNILAFSHLKDFEDLDYIFELNWRLEKCLFPIWNDIVPYFQKILDRYNFFPNYILENKEINEDQKNYNIAWEKYRGYWIHLSLSLLRFYREENFDTEWNSTQKTLNSVKECLSSDQLSFFYYEQILRAIFKMSHHDARNKLDEWPQNNISIFWNAKRAMLISELGQSKEAANLLEADLIEIRKKLNLSPIEEDYTWVSLESYIMFQLKMIQENIRRKNEIDIEEFKAKNDNYNERWNDLLQYNCDPWGEKKYFDLMLQQAYIPTTNHSKQNEFEIGKSTSSFSIGPTPKDFIVAYSFLRYLEELAIPLSLSNVNFSQKTINGVLERIRLVSPQWGIALLNRNNDENTVDIVFSREQLLKLPSHMIDSYATEYIKLFYNHFSEKKTTPLTITFVNKIPFILSRLCTKCNDKVKLDIYGLCKELYTKELILPKSEKLLVNLINCSNNEILAKAAEIMLDIPVLNSNWTISYTLIEPFDLIKPNKITRILKWKKETFDFLIEKCKEDEFRQNAITRLMFLYNSNQLNKIQSQKLFKIIWSKVDEKDGFPQDTVFYKFPFIKWGISKRSNVEEMFKKYIEKNNFDVQGEKTEGGVSMSKGRDRYTEEVFYGSQSINNKDGVIWKINELESILSKCEKWWDSDKKYVSEEKYKNRSFAGSIHDEFLSRFINLTDILSRVIGFRQKELSPNIIQRINALTDDLERRNIPVLNVKVVYGFYNSYEDYFKELIGRMQSNNRQVLLNALNSVILAVHCSYYQHNSNFIIRLLQVLKIPLEWRIIKLLGDIFDVFQDLIKHSDSELSNVEEDLLNSLQQVLDINITIEDAEISFNDYLILKQKSIRLASTLHNKYLQKNIVIPQVLLDFKAISEDKEEFSDIRNRWESN